MATRRKTKAQLEQELAEAIDSQRVLHHQLHAMRVKHEGEMKELREKLGERKLAVLEKLASNMAQGFEAASRPLAMLASEGFPR
jgi:hypothetical protein